MYDAEFGEVRLGQMGSGGVRCGSIGSGGVISHTATKHCSERDRTGRDHHESKGGPLQCLVYRVNTGPTLLSRRR